MRWRWSGIAVLLVVGCAAPDGEPPAAEPIASDTAEPAEASAPQTPSPSIDPTNAEPTDTAGFIPPLRDSVRQGPIYELPAPPEGPTGSRTDQ